MQSVRILVPGPVRGKGRPRFAVRGKFARAYTDKRTQDYELLIKRCALQVMKGSAPLTGPLCVKLIAHFEPPKSATKTKRRAMLSGLIMPTVKPDIDNILKMIDALNGVCFEDDKQIVSAHCEKRYADEPGLSIEVSAVTPTDLFAEQGDDRETAALVKQ